jgi:DNA-directed RNA polymerase subunit RPC12/RpoP
MFNLITRFYNYILSLFAPKPNVEGLQVGHTKCGYCGNENLLKIRTLRYKICTDCGRQIYWPLEKDQKPLK